MIWINVPKGPGKGLVPRVMLLWWAWELRLRALGHWGYPFKEDYGAILFLLLFTPSFGELLLLPHVLTMLCPLHQKLKEKST